MIYLTVFLLILQLVRAAAKGEKMRESSVLKLWNSSRRVKDEECRGLQE